MKIISKKMRDILLKKCKNFWKSNFESETKRGELGKKDKGATDPLVMQNSCDANGSYKIKTRSNEDLLSTSNLEENYRVTWDFEPYFTSGRSQND